MKTKTIILITLSILLSISINAQDPSKKIMESLMGKNKPDPSKLPDVYDFDWEFKT